MRTAIAALLAMVCFQDSKLKQQLKDDCDKSWIYDDVGTGFAQAKKTGKPLMIVFR